MNLINNINTVLAEMLHQNLLTPRYIICAGYDSDEDLLNDVEEHAALEKLFLYSWGFGSQFVISFHHNRLFNMIKDMDIEHKGEAYNAIINKTIDYLNNPSNAAGYTAAHLANLTMQSYNEYRKENILPPKHTASFRDNGQIITIVHG